MRLSVLGSTSHSRHDAIARPRSSFRADIEGLRAVAVLAVVGYHFGVTGLQGGFVGVDIFFVISGYLISGLLVTELNKTGRIDLLRFYGRRARRLLPAAFLVTLTTLICGAFILSPLEQQSMARAAIASSLYLSNFWFLRQTFDYFSPESALNPFLHTWSLSVEEQFYIFWPALLMLAARARNNPRLLAITMAAATLISFVLCLWFTRMKQPWAFYASPLRAWEFGLGGLASVTPVAGWIRASSPAIGWLGVLLLLFSCIAINDASGFPGAIALLPAGATTCILISGVSGNPRGPAALLNIKPFQWIGTLSYSIYLWHWPIIVYATIIEPFLSLWGRLICAGLTLACAAASYQLLEQPIRWNRWLSSLAVRSVGLGAALTLAGTFTAIGTATFAKRFAMSPNQRMISEVTSQMPIASNSGRGCLIGFTDSEPTACAFGAATPVRTVVLFGDSHADQWSTPLVSLADQENWRVVTYLKASCSVADILVYNMRLHRFTQECPEWRAKALAEIVHLRADMVVITQFSSSYIRGPLSNLGEHAVDLATWSEGLRRSLHTLHAAGIPVILLRDSPTPGRDMRYCLARADWHGLPTSICETPRSFGLDALVTKTELDAAASVPGVHFIDMSSEFCNPTTCPPIREGTIVYRDANHLTADYAAHLLEPLRHTLLPIINAL
jgi:peptidoglycan/LPS O-acetylase OafA/YrhL